MNSNLEKMEIITIADVISFYSEKDFSEQECPNTFLYLKDHDIQDKKSKGYRGVYEKYIQIRNNESIEENDDVVFIKYINSLQDGEYKFSDSLKIDLRTIVPTSECGRFLSEKWHLLVCVYAYLDAANNHSPGISETLKKKGCKLCKDKKILDITQELARKEKKEENSYSGWKLSNFFMTYRCESLRLWMAEAAGIEDVLIEIEGDKRHDINYKKVTWNNVYDKILKWKIERYDSNCENH